MEGFGDSCVDSGIGLSMAGTDVLPEMEKVAHKLIWDGYKDEVWRHGPAKLFESHSSRRFPRVLITSEDFLCLWIWS